jgi:membrane dipeptidase
VLVDISHVSDETAIQTLFVSSDITPMFRCTNLAKHREVTRAPVIWSHSASRHFNNISRNVPDYIIKKIGSGRHQVDGVVMVNIYPAFMLPQDQQDHADVSTVADHVEWMAGLIGKKQ